MLFSFPSLEAGAVPEEQSSKPSSSILLRMCLLCFSPLSIKTWKLNLDRTLITGLTTCRGN